MIITASAAFYSIRKPGGLTPHPPVHPACLFVYSVALEVACPLQLTAWPPEPVRAGDPPHYHPQQTWLPQLQFGGLPSPLPPSGPVPTAVPVLCPPSVLSSLLVCSAKIATEGSSGERTETNVSLQSDSKHRLEGFVKRLRQTLIVEKSLVCSGK